MDILTKKVLENIKPIYRETGSWSNSENAWSMNLSGMLTHLIQETGRFVEYYASDMLITLRHVDEWLHDKDFEHDALLFGLRESGVDHEAYIRSRLEQCTVYSVEKHRIINDYYRKIYAIEGYIEENKLVIVLKPVSDSITEIANHKPVTWATKLKTDNGTVTIKFDKINQYDEPKAHVTLPDGTELKITHRQHKIDKQYEYFKIERYEDDWIYTAREQDEETMHKTVIDLCMGR